ncbi:MAG: hypothetical protein IIA91_09285 [Chloroflexi bacterium]|nr:hypothetical protein [Chloroflexota bacterium]
MPKGRGYDIFPQSYKARVLLAIAFWGGLPLIMGWVAFLVLGGDAISEPFKLHPCTGSEREGCLEAQTALEPVAQASCEGSDRRVCFVPLGQVDPDLVLNLVEYYRDEYGLEIGVLTPSAVPAAMINPNRRQIDGESLADYVGRLFPADFANPDVALIGLTPLDLYAADRNWRFQLGHATWAPQAHAVVSTYRMHLGTSRLVDDERVLSRTRKLVTKYLGLMFYGLPLSDDPTSPMFGNILSVGDLDRMEEVLPVSVGP